MELIKLKSVIIAPAALAKIREMVSAIGFREVGGPMVGYRTEDGKLFVIDVEGPGPKGKCLPFNVEIDGEHAQQFCDDAFYGSDGRLDYVGDWHCHPSISMRPSQGDRHAMKLLADTPGLVPNPVSLIYSNILRSFRVYQWWGGDLISLARDKSGESQF